MGISQAANDAITTWQQGDIKVRANMIGNGVGEVVFGVLTSKGAGALGKLNILSKLRKVAKVGGSAAKGGGWLNFHEGLGGHTVARHVGKTDADLIARLSSSSTISGASTFSSQAVAESVISSTIGSNRATLNAWLRSGSTRNLVLEYIGTSAIGRGIMRGQSAVTDLMNARVILKTTGNGRYYILTSFPR